MAIVRTTSQSTLRAREMRKGSTPAEARMWGVLRAGRLGGWKWKRQVPRGPYILDFLCVDAGLIVEVDGGQHSEQVEYDERRTRFLEAEGLRVLRFWNADVLQHTDDLALTILQACGGERPVSPEGHR